MARTQLTNISAGGSGNRADEMLKEAEAAIAQDADARADYQSAGLPPDWLTSGLAGAGAGWVFGPVGGLIGAGVTAIMSKRRKAGIIAQATSNAETASSLIEDGEATVASLEAAAETDQDQFEASIVRNEYEMAKTLAQSLDPQAAAAGFGKILAIPGLVSGEADEIEAAQLAREQVAREDNIRIFDNFQTIQDDFRADTSSFEMERDAYKKLTSSLAAGTAAGDLSAIFSLMKQMDPISVVREGEFATAASAGGADERVVGLYNRMLTGERLTDTQRADFQNTGIDLYKTALDRYLDQESRMISESQFARVPNELIDTAKLPYVIPGEKRAVSIDPPDPGETEPTRRVIEPSLLARGLQQFGQETVELVQDIGRQGRGEKVIQEGNRFWLEDADGRTLKELDAPNQMFPDSPFTVPSVETSFNEFQQQQRDEHNARIRQDRIRMGADPETGLIRIERDTND